MLYAPKDVVIVQIDKKTNDEILISGGIKLWQETRLNMQEHVTLNGKAISIPPVLKRDDLRTINPQVRVGDDVYFNYSAIFDQNLVGDTGYHMNLLEHDNQGYWLIDYSTILFCKRDEHIIMIGGHTLVEPCREKTQHNGFLLLPDYMRDRKRLDKGIVIAIGDPLLDKVPVDVKPLDVIAFDEKYVQQYKFWNKDYFIVKQDRILAKYAN